MSQWRRQRIRAPLRSEFTWAFKILVVCHGSRCSGRLFVPFTLSEHPSPTVVQLVLRATRLICAFVGKQIRRWSTSELLLVLLQTQSGGSQTLACQATSRTPKVTSQRTLRTTTSQTLPPLLPLRCAELLVRRRSVVVTVIVAGPSRTDAYTLPNFANGSSTSGTRSKWGEGFNGMLPTLPVLPS